MTEYHNPAKLAEFFALIAEHGAEEVEWRSCISNKWYVASECYPSIGHNKQPVLLASRLRQKQGVIQCLEKRDEYVATLRGMI